MDIFNETFGEISIMSYVGIQKREQLHKKKVQIFESHKFYGCSF